MGRARAWDDYERLRASLLRPSDADDRPPVAGAPAFVGEVLSPQAEIAVGRFLLVAPTVVLGAEAEGGPGAFNVIPMASVPVYLLGPSVPAQGDFLVCRFVDHRWVAERGTSSSGGSTPPITIPSCYCPVPPKLAMTSSDPSCNYGMFQPCTISYQATPSWAADLGLGPMIFLSDRAFDDPIEGYPFYYFLYCQSNQFNLTRLYPMSSYGSAYRDALLYSWLLGGYANSCNPFSLDGGNPFPGSDASCAVQINPA